jgi:hypothetical protein
MIDKLRRLVETSRPGGNASEFLTDVRQLVYGDEGYQSRFRIDECEMTGISVRVIVSDRLLHKNVFMFVTPVRRIRSLSLVA